MCVGTYTTLSTIGAGALPIANLLRRLCTYSPALRVSLPSPESGARVRRIRQPLVVSVHYAAVERRHRNSLRSKGPWHTGVCHLEEVAKDAESCTFSYLSVSHPCVCVCGAGMNKMVINYLDKLFVTSDAATMLSEMEVQHPAAKMIVLAAKAQEAELGDGTNLVRPPPPCYPYPRVLTHALRTTPLTTA